MRAGANSVVNTMRTETIYSVLTDSYGWCSAGIKLLSKSCRHQPQHTCLQNDDKWLSYGLSVRGLNAIN